MSPFECSAVLMMGGASRRMGRDKATLPYGEELLWRHQLNTLKATGFRALALSVGETFPLACGQAEVGGYPLLPDQATGQGPISGLREALRWSSTEQVLLLAVDLPKMSAAYLKKLLASAEQGAGVLPIHGEFIEPLVALYPQAALPVVEDLIARQQYKLQGVTDAGLAAGWLQTLPIEPEEEALFANWNRPEDVERA